MNRKHFRARYSAFAVIGIVLVFTALPAVAADQTWTVPDWTLSDPEGNTVNFYTHSAGRPAVLLFWATWCPYCRELMPHLEQLRGEFAQDVNFYALNIWEDGDPVAHMAENGYGSRLMLKADTVAKSYGVKGTPGLIVVDRDHRVLYTRTSGTSPSEVEATVRSVLNEVLE